MGYFIILIYNQSPTPHTFCGEVCSSVHFPERFSPLGENFPKGWDNSKYFINGGGRGLYMKWNCPVGNIVDPVDLVDLLDPVAFYRCFT